MKNDKYKKLRDAVGKLNRDTWKMGSGSDLDDWSCYSRSDGTSQSQAIVNQSGSVVGFAVDHTPCAFSDCDTDHAEFIAEARNQIRAILAELDAKTEALEIAKPIVEVSYEAHQSACKSAVLKDAYQASFERFNKLLEVGK